MKRCFFVFPAIICLLSGPISAENLKRIYYPQVFFQKESAYQNLTAGTSSIRGVAYVTDPMGSGTYYAHGSMVVLYPVTDYLAEWLRLSDKFKSTPHEIYMPAEVFETRKETIADKNGNFFFDGLKPGKYYLETVVKYQSVGVASQQNGTVVGIMGGVPYSYPTYGHYEYNYNTQKRVSKKVDIEAPNQMLPVKLHPGISINFGFGLGKLAALGESSSLCYEEGNLLYGTCHTFYPQGQLKSIGKWKEGHLHGDYRRFDEKGNIIISGELHKGEKVGDWSYFFIDNPKVVESMGHYKILNGESVRHGEYKTFYPSNALKQVDTFINGKGENSIHYFESGKLNWKSGYKAGVLHGDTVIYNENGDIVEHVIYSDGKIVAEPVPYKK